MKTRRRETPRLETPRDHPWTDSVSNSSSRYYDFKAQPQLVRTSLEDLAPWSGRAAVETFYSLLEWINAPGGAFESNDCEFTGPHANPDPEFRKAQECGGRLMILYRNLPLNLSRPRAEWLEGAVHRHLAELDPAFEWGVVGTTVMRTRYVGIPVPDEDQLGYQLMLSFWAWGDTEDETMAHLDRLFGNLARALHEAAVEMRSFSPTRS
jgi:hypothetical protein